MKYLRLHRDTFKFLEFEMVLPARFKANVGIWFEDMPKGEWELEMLEMDFDAPENLFYDTNCIGNEYYTGWNRALLEKYGDCSDFQSIFVNPLHTNERGVPLRPREVPSLKENLNLGYSPQFFELQYKWLLWCEDSGPYLDFYTQTDISKSELDAICKALSDTIVESYY